MPALSLSLIAALARRGTSPAATPAASRGPALGAVSAPSGERRRRRKALNRTVYPDSPLRLFFTDASTGAQTRTVWDPTTQNPLQDLNGSNALVTDYLMGNEIDEPLGRVAGGATHAFLGDHLMSIRGLVDSAGVQTNRYTYAAFGLGRSQVEVVANRLRFTARELDPATGLQFNRHRHYLASLGRWTQRDPLGFPDGTNQYVYVVANPVGNVDPLGLETRQACLLRCTDRLLICTTACNVIGITNCARCLALPFPANVLCAAVCAGLTYNCLNGCLAQNDLCKAVCPCK